MSPMHPNDRLAISRGQRERYASMSAEEYAEFCEKQRERAIIREANFKLNPDPSRNRGHRFQPGHTYGIGNGKHIEEGMIVARTLKQLAWQVYRDNPQLIYQAIVDGVQSEPPRSVPYLALLLKCEEDIMAAPGTVNAEWVNFLTPAEHEELRAIMADERLQRIMSAAKGRMQGRAEQDIVIDLPPAPQGTGEQ